MILHVRVLAVAKRKSRRAVTPGHFLRKMCKKAKETWEWANSASAGTLQCWVPASSFVSQLQKSSFLLKKCFFAKLTEVYSTAKLGLLRGIQCKAILCVLSSRSLTFAIYTHDDFVVLLYTSLTPRSPGTLFLALFLEGFWARACKDIICILAQKRLFCNVKKVRACLRL